MIVELSDAEWQQVLGMLALAPWRDANPLLMKIGEQLRARQQDQDPQQRRSQAPREGTWRQTESLNSSVNSSGAGNLKQ